MDTNKIVWRIEGMPENIKDMPWPTEHVIEIVDVVMGTFTTIIYAKYNGSLNR